MKLLAIIPARGGSKRLPRKNVLLFGGRPLICWSIALARKIDAVAHVVVSTDDAEIAHIAADERASVIDRPAHLATDNASSIDVMIHAADHVRRSGTEFDAVMLLQPTNPLRPSDMVRQAVSQFQNASCDSLVAVSRRPLKLGSIVEGYFHASYAYGTQSRLMPVTAYENGWLYLTRSDVLLDQKSLTGDRVLAFETERPFDDVDIDEAVDLVVGEAILAAVRNRIDY